MGDFYGRTEERAQDGGFHIGMVRSCCQLESAHAWFVIRKTADNGNGCHFDHVFTAWFCHVLYTWCTANFAIKHVAIGKLLHFRVKPYEEFLLAIRKLSPGNWERAMKFAIMIGVNAVRVILYGQKIRLTTECGPVHRN